MTVACALAQTRVVTGTVVSAADDEPLAGATVMPIGGGQGTSTDIDGNFSLEVKNPKAQLQISYIGFTTITVPVQLKGKMTITMQEASRNLDEVVVIGYGSVKRKDVTTAISSVSTKDLDMRPIVSA